MINKYFYALFLGLYLLREYIPQWLQDFIVKEQPNYETSNWILLTMLAHGNYEDKDDKHLRSLVMKGLE